MIKLGFVIGTGLYIPTSNDGLLPLKVPGAIAYAANVVNKEFILPEGYKIQFKVLVYF